MSQSSFGWKQIFAILALIGILLGVVGTAWLGGGMTVVDPATVDVTTSSN